MCVCLWAAACTMATVHMREGQKHCDGLFSPALWFPWIERISSNWAARVLSYLTDWLSCSLWNRSDCLLTRSDFQLVCYDLCFSLPDTFSESITGFSILLDSGCEIISSALG